jgi:hypothetical protein
MAVDIDKSGSYGLTGCVNNLHSRCTAQFTDAHHFAILDSDIRLEPGIATTIHDMTVFHHYIVHNCSSQAHLTACRLGCKKTDAYSIISYAVSVIAYVYRVRFCFEPGHGTSSFGAYLVSTLPWYTAL